VTLWVSRRPVPDAAPTSCSRCRRVCTADPAAARSPRAVQSVPTTTKTELPAPDDCLAAGMPAGEVLERSVPWTGAWAGQLTTAAVQRHRLLAEDELLLHAQTYTVTVGNKAPFTTAIKVKSYNLQTASYKMQQATCTAAAFKLARKWAAPHP